MNERFKFRFWNKSKNRYVNTEKLVLNDGTYTQVGTKQMNNGTYCSYIVNEYNTSDIIPEQCTGLRDKNSKLIYEGDIVQMSYPYSPNNKYMVKWGDCCWELWLENGFVYVIYEKMSHSIEVIGNIHENADLIKVGGK